MRELVNMVAPLDDPRFSREAAAATRASLERAGYAIEACAVPDDAVLAWIDEAFGGWWSSEARASHNIIARRNGAPAGFASFDARGLRFAWLPSAETRTDTGIFGPFGVSESERGGPLGRGLLQLALAALRERGYTRALIGATRDALVEYYAAQTGAIVTQRFAPGQFVREPARTLVMASGNGSNFQAVLDGVAAGKIPVRIDALVCNDPAARAIARAHAAGVATHVVTWDRVAGETRAQYDARLLASVVAKRPELVLLLGWMHLLEPRFVEAMPALLNVHPAFLPLDPQRDVVGMPDGSAIAVFRGARAVRDAMRAGSRWVGASVHHVTAQTDRGDVLVRAPLAIAPGESEEDVLAKLHPIEHGLIERAIWRWTYEREASGHAN